MGARALLPGHRRARRALVESAAAVVVVVE